MALTEGKRAGDFIQSLAVGDRSKENVTIQSGQDVVAGEVLAAVLVATAAAGAGNTGDGAAGAVTLGADAQVGIYELEATALGPGGLTATAAAGGGNTGDGAMGAVTEGADIEIGVYELECTSTGPGVAAAGTGAADANSHSGGGNTGNGTITGSPATGANAVVGTYRAVCIGVDANLGEFEVTDPNGVVLGVALVATEFSVGSHVTFTIADGSTDFDEGDAFTIVVAAGNSGTFSVLTPEGYPLPDLTVAVAYSSNHFSVTLADGSTDFIVGDTFTITVAGTDSGTFSVLTPGGIPLPDLTVAVAYATNHFSVTLADGSADFIVGDTFTITVAGTDSGTFSVTAPDGTPLGDLTVAVAYSNTHFGITIADGSADFIVGDTFTITMAEDDWVAVVFAGTDGSQIARGISYDNYDASAADKAGVVICRDAEVNADELTWPAGATSAQKAQAGRELEARGIFQRKGTPLPTEGHRS